MNRPLIRSTAFVRAAKRYTKRHPDSVERLWGTLAQLSEDAFHPALRSHKLKGQFAGSWACSAGYDLRIIFAFV